MKTLVLFAGLLFLSVASFAGTKSPKLINKNTTAITAKASALALLVAEVRMTATYVSSCGVTWSCVSHGASLGEAVNRMYSLTQACDAACGTSTTLIVQ